MYSRLQCASICSRLAPEQTLWIWKISSYPTIFFRLIGRISDVLYTQNGWGWNHFIKEANSGNGFEIPQIIRGYMTYVLPWIVVIIYLKGYYDMFSKQSTTVFVTWMIIGFLFLTLVLSVTRRKKTENK